MMKKITTVLLLFIVSNVFAQKSIEKVVNTLEAISTADNIKIDGELNEASWKSAPIASDFKLRQPNPGNPQTQRSEVKVLYDNTSIYIGAMLFDDPDSISLQLTSRDQLSNTDWFGILLSPYRDGTNGNGFIMTSAGVQFDTKYTSQGEDTNWDAVWEGEIKIVENGWVVEMKIPYAALRFPKTAEQLWDLNFVRTVFRSGENGFWNHIDRNVNGFLTQFGKLQGISNIKSPIRLQATPFIAGYLENFNDKAEADPQNAWGRSFNAGMDIKYGLTDAFTLDMTLIPDFGEAQSDNQVLNLTQFEVQFDENRQFFTEGTELFNKGGLFYSRRIGGSPLRYADDYLESGEEVLEEAQTTQLINATKISGRTKGGTGIGFFNADAAETFAVIRMEDGGKRKLQTSPLTNYNVFVVDQNLKNNSSATIINTNVWRSGSDYDANVTGGLFKLNNKKQSYGIEGGIAVSQLYFPNNEQYTDYVNSELYITEEEVNKLLDNPNQKNLLGHQYDIEISKISGRFNWDLSYGVENHTLDINDLGFLRSNNEETFDLSLSYDYYEPFGIFNSMGGGIWTGVERLYRPNKFAEYGINTWWWAQTKKFWNFNIWTYHEPINGNDYFEPRTPGRYFEAPKLSNFGMNINSDGRKKLRGSLSTNYGFTWDLYKASWAGFSPSLTLRASDRFTISWSGNNFFQKSSVGFVADYLDPIDNEEIILGKRDQLTTINTFNAGYNFNKNMNVTFRLRHYWSLVEYKSFHALQEDGSLENTTYDEFNDLSFNFWNIDMVYRWRFAPGSDIYLTWKNSLSDISEEADYIQYSYGKGLKELDRFPVSNSLSLKIIYFLDYQSFVRKGRQS